jgi:hypothetical protein
VSGRCDRRAGGDKAQICDAEVGIPLRASFGDNSVQMLVSSFLSRLPIALNEVLVPAPRGMMATMHKDNGRMYCGRSTAMDNLQVLF